MFKPAKLEFLRVFALERDDATVLRELGQLGLVQLTRANAHPDGAWMTVADYKPELTRTSHLLSRISALRQTLNITPRPGPADRPSMTTEEADRELSGLEKESAILRAQHEDVARRLSETARTLNEVQIFQGAALPLDWQSRSAFLHFAIGSVATDRFESVRTQLAGKAQVLNLKEQSGRCGLLVASTIRDRPLLDQVLGNAGFQEQATPSGTQGTYGEWIASRGLESRNLADLKNNLGRQIASFAHETALRLEEIEMAARCNTAFAEARECVARTKSLVLFTGWVPADEVGRICERIRDITHNQSVIETGFPENIPENDIPVLLKHGSLVRPFAALVKAYGLPLYHEFEPTVLMAVSYVIMFGIMFGDVGHGAILVTAGLILRFWALTERAQDAGTLLLFAGASSMTFGFVYGSFFGLPNFRRFALWRDPLEGNPLVGMYATVALGIVLMTVGVFLNVLNRLRRHDWSGAIFDRFGAISGLLYWSSIALILVSARDRTHQRSGAWLLWPIAFLLAALIVHKPLRLALEQRSHWKQCLRQLLPVFAEGIIEPFEALLSYFANTISFVRLAAYAMSHAAILAAAFGVAATFKNSPALAVTTIVLGNLLAILLEGIVASIQALRLEYYEFFGKFLSGAGPAFKPFQLTPVSLLGSKSSALPAV